MIILCFSFTVSTALKFLKSRMDSAAFSQKVRIHAVSVLYQKCSRNPIERSDKVNIKVTYERMKWSLEKQFLKAIAVHVLEKIVILDL